MSEELVYRLTCDYCDAEMEFDHHHQLARYRAENNWITFTDNHGCEVDRCETCTKRAVEKGL